VRFTPNRYASLCAYMAGAGDRIGPTIQYSVFVMEFTHGHGHVRMLVGEYGMIWHAKIKIKSKSSRLEARLASVMMTSYVYMNNGVRSVLTLPVIIEAT
jgi:hypothetical protein